MRLTHLHKTLLLFPLPLSSLFVPIRCLFHSLLPARVVAGAVARCGCDGGGGMLMAWWRHVVLAGCFVVVGLVN